MRESSRSLAGLRPARAEQEAAAAHAAELGVAVEGLLERGVAWVLSQLKLEILRWPRAGDTLVISTWPEAASGTRTERRFLLSAATGEELGQALTLWLVLDLERRRPVRLPDFVVAALAPVVRSSAPTRLAVFAAVVESRDRCILELLDRPRTIVELIEASPIYGGRAYAPGVLDYWEGQMIRKRLERQGRAHRTGPGDADLGDLELDVTHAEVLQGAAAKPDRFHDRTRWMRR